MARLTHFLRLLALMMMMMTYAFSRDIEGRCLAARFSEVLLKMKENEEISENSAPICLTGQALQVCQWRCERPTLHTRSFF
ncbi:hypothetical protein F4803DRAFT_526039 [Xylaria telfairii]|nr:hypothetical protein F4803DRAFT_526039 [Xylaria telfairii]